MTHGETRGGAWNFGSGSMAVMDRRPHNGRQDLIGKMPAILMKFIASFFWNNCRFKDLCKRFMCSMVFTCSENSDIFKIPNRSMKTTWSISCLMEHSKLCHEHPVLTKTIRPQKWITLVEPASVHNTISFMCRNNNVWYLIYIPNFFAQLLVGKCLIYFTHTG